MHVKTPPDTPAHVNQGATPNRLYNSREARELLGGISESTFRRLTASGDLEAKKQGAFVYVSQRALEAYIEQLPTVSESEQESTAAA
jgi:hypothetical protein